jgi:hypothetical protein
MVFRIRITVFGGSLPSDPSGKVNFTNERGVVSLVAWPEAAGEVAARYRPNGKTQPQTANKRFMDMYSQLTQDMGQSERAAAIMLVPRDDAKREYAPHSHSMVPGGLEVMSYTTRLMPRTSLMMRRAAWPRKSWLKS